MRLQNKVAIVTGGAQGIGGGIEMVGAMGAAPVGPRGAGRPPGAGALVLPGAGPMAGGLGGFEVGVWHRSALFMKSVLLCQGGGNRPRGISGGLCGWFWTSRRIAAWWAPLPLWCGLQATKAAHA